MLRMKPFVKYFPSNLFYVSTFCAIYHIYCSDLNLQLHLMFENQSENHKQTKQTVNTFCNIIIYQLWVYF